MPGSAVYPPGRIWRRPNAASPPATMPAANGKPVGPAAVSRLGRCPAPAGAEHPAAESAPRGRAARARKRPASGGAAPARARTCTQREEQPAASPRQREELAQEQRRLRRATASRAGAGPSWRHRPRPCARRHASRRCSGGRNSRSTCPAIRRVPASARRGCLRAGPFGTAAQAPLRSRAAPAGRLRRRVAGRRRAAEGNTLRSSILGITPPIP